MQEANHQQEDGQQDKIFLCACDLRSTNLFYSSTYVNHDCKELLESCGILLFSWELQQMHPRVHRK